MFYLNLKWTVLILKYGSNSGATFSRIGFALPYEGLSWILASSALKIRRSDVNDKLIKI